MSHLRSLRLLRSHKWFGGRGLAVVSWGDSKIALLRPRLEMSHGNLDRVYVFQKRNNMCR